MEQNRRMSFVALSRFTVANGMTQQVKDAFRSRPGYVESAPGFLRMDVISPVSNSDEILLITYWTDQGSYETWHKSDAHHQSHKFIPKGLKVVPGSTRIEFYEHVSS
jgi:heme-degrading monooxygenase HmoA